MPLPFLDRFFRKLEDHTEPRSEPSTTSPRAPWGGSFDYARLCRGWERVELDGSHWFDTKDCPGPCDGCQLVLEAIDAMLEVNPIYIAGQRVEPDFAYNNPYNFRFQVSHRLLRGVSLLLITCVGSAEGLCQTVISARKGTPNPWNLVGKPTVLLRGFDATIDLVRHWLSNCSRNHSSCTYDEDAVLPTRVLDVGSNESDVIKLYETQSEKGRYICLSYCWGKARFTNTTRETLEKRKRGIHIRDLPRTFRDVIHIARALAIRYVWIDSLCIIQGDSADWEREAGRMCDVYSRSYLTLAPTWADSPFSGCFRTPDGGIEIGPVIASQAYHQLRYGEAASRYRFYPLVTRAWTYQERMLSPRIVYFNRHEISFACWQGSTCECGSTNRHGSEVDKEDFQEKMTNPQLTSNGLYGRDEMWRHMVVEYSALNLTYLKDRLPAMAGLAAKMQHHSKKEYVAGLWKETLIPDMCWFVPPGAQNMEGSLPTSHVPVLRKLFRRKLPPASTELFERSPTWSWASVDKVVEYPSFLWMVDAKNTNFTPFAQVVDVQVPSMDTSHPEGSPRGFVELDCHPIPVRALEPAQSGESFFDINFPARYRPDKRSEVTVGNEYYLIPMLTGDPSLPGQFWALIVRPWQNDPAQMIRTGLAICHTDFDMFQPGQIAVQDILDRYEKRRVKII